MNDFNDLDRADARAWWSQVQRAANGKDDRRFWLMWRAAYQHRYWRPLGASSASALCREVGLDHAAVLKRLVTYEWSSRNREQDEVDLKRLIDGPPPPVE